MSKYHSTLCGCIYDVDAVYNWMDQKVEIEAVVLTHVCDKHLPEKNDRKDIRILELLEQNRQLKAKCKRVDEYDEVVDLNAALVDALEKIANPSITPLSDYVFWAKDIAKQALALVEGDK